MHCEIAQKKMRPFAKLVGCFSRIADEVAIETSPQDGVILRAVSLAQSGYVGARLLPRFFDDYSVPKRIPRCKVSLKSLHAILKSVANVEKCIMRIDEGENRLIFEFHCRLRVKKVFKLAYEDSEPLQAVYTKEECPNYLLLKTKILADATQNIATSIEEIGILATHNRVKLRTHVGPESVLSKVLLSEVILVDKDFDSYRVVDGSQELIFPLKELKAVIQLADKLGLSVGIHFNAEAGAPIIFSLEGQQQLLQMTVDVVLATQVDNNNTNMLSPAGTPSKAPSSASPRPSPTPNSQQAAPARASATLSGMSPVNSIPGIPTTSTSTAKRHAAVAAQSDSDMRSGDESGDQQPKRSRPTPSPPPAIAKLSIAPTAPPTAGAGATVASAPGAPTGGSNAAGATTTSASTTVSVPKRVLWINNLNDDDEDMGDAAAGGGGGGGAAPMTD